MSERTAEDAYLELYSVLASEGEVLQAPINNYRASLPPEWVITTLETILLGAVGNGVADGVAHTVHRIRLRIARRDGRQEEEPQQEEEQPYEDSLALVQILLERGKLNVELDTYRSAVDVLTGLGLQGALAEAIADDLESVLIQFVTRR